MARLTYSIDKNLSEKFGGLILKIEAAEYDGITTQFLSEKIFNIQQLRKLATPDELIVVNWLIQSELTYLKKTGKRIDENSISFNTIHISHSNTAQALKLLASTGKLYFNRRLLIPDIFSKVEYYYLAEGSLVSGHLKTPTEEFALTDCDFICGGPPHWYIKGLMLQVIATDVSWNMLKCAFDQTNVLSLKQVKDSLVGDDEDPKIVFVGAEESTEEITDPLPVLKLKDRTGAFADLWMEYKGQRYSFYNYEVSKTRSSIRNRSAELAWEKDLLETDFIRKIVGSSHFYCPLDKVSKSLTFLLEIGWQILDWQDNRVVRYTDKQLFLQEFQETILLKGKIKYESYETDITNLMGAFNRRERFLQLGSGVVGLLPQNEAELDLSVLAEGEILGEGIKIKRSHFGLLSGLVKPTTETPESELWQTLIGKPLPVVAPSPQFQGQLRPYQQQGLEWMASLYYLGFHGILADDMGLGKTIQVLAFLSQLPPKKKPILIVLPTSLLFNWQREIEQFLLQRRVYLHHGPARLKSEQELASSDIILTSYALVRLDLSLLSQISFECVILDEAQTIKNPHTQVAKAVCTLQARFRLAITGTPIENKATEIWSHFHFLMPDLLGEEKDFNADILAASSDIRYLQKIKKKIRPFILRRKKEDVAKDLPERIEQVVWIEMSPTQRQIYDSFLAGIRGNLFKKIEMEGFTKHRMEVLEAILRLRQICCHPMLVTAQLEEGLAMDSAKLEALLQDVDTAIAEERKVLIFSQFTSMLQIIAKAIKERKIGYVYLDGSTVDREGVVKQFQEKKDISIFLISLKAGGVGLNLTAADYVFLYDPWWNEAVENQAINRTHRIGRQQTVFAKRYITVESIEEKMMKLKSAKRSLIDQMLDSELSNVNLNEEDLLFLLS